MKRRKGFVANSSSASYIVNIYLDIKSIYQDIIGQMGWNYFDYDKIVSNLNESIEGLLIENKEEKNNSSLKWFKNTRKRFLEKDRKLLKEIKKRKNNKIELVKYLLIEYYGISIEEKDDNVEFVYYTSMHNSYVDNMSKILNELIMYYLMETNIKVNCKLIDHDSDRMFD